MKALAPTYVGFFWISRRVILFFSQLISGLCFFNQGIPMITRCTGLDITLKHMWDSWSPRCALNGVVSMVIFPYARGRPSTTFATTGLFFQSTGIPCFLTSPSSMKHEEAPESTRAVRERVFLGMINLTGARHVSMGVVGIMRPFLISWSGCRVSFTTGLPRFPALQGWLRLWSLFSCSDN
ncbi:hypothetical protein KP509_08G069600 [Ceratopteris richardii]|uniref:Uncharacterized protein n=1 Tax=Ceratopteris richardii TaxID=49495 RepID=A0A8T2UDI6_CERRI|nr:hypothetical protein KP509_08G069600 [Ceratopteris richardii]